VNKKPIVISVGNIALGGTGKTPFTIMIANKFISMGKKVCILSRGYKGKVGYDTTVLSDGDQIFLTPPEAADEPYMIAQSCPGSIVITGKDRTRSYNYANQQYQPDIFILDDGFQHKKMHRDVDILLMDHCRPVSTGLPFPFGYLRELPMGISRADIVVFTRANTTNIVRRVRDFVEDKPVFFSKIAFQGLRKDGVKIPQEEIYNCASVVFAGIAGSGRFFGYMMDRGLYVVGKKQFADHHTYTEKDIQKIIEYAKHKKAEYIVTTEKDFVKIPEQYRSQITVAEIDIELNNDAGFWNALFEKIDYPLIEIPEGEEYVDDGTF
jgi:tetraacyldisaccharide 4'-kinase